MQQTKPGATVRLHYMGMLDDGSVFDSSRGREPLEFVLGAGQVIPGLEEAVIGMQVGEEKRVSIPAEAAYGPHRSDLVLAVAREQFPDHIKPVPGQQLQMTRGEQVSVVTVQDVSGDAVVLDANHPLAGKDLTFALELVEVS